VTDGQTDRQNYDPQDRASIAASCFKNIRNSQTLNLLNQECNSSTVIPLSTNVASQRGIESLFMWPAFINLMYFTLYSYCEGRNFAILLKFVSSEMTIITKSLRRCQSKLPRGNSQCGKQNWRHCCSGCAVIGPILAHACFRIGNRKKPSVYPSHASTLSRRMKIRSCVNHCKVAKTP